MEFGVDGILRRVDDNGNEVAPVLIPLTIIGDCGVEGRC